MLRLPAPYLIAAGALAAALAVALAFQAGKRSERAGWLQEQARLEQQIQRERDRVRQVADRLSVEYAQEREALLARQAQLQGRIRNALDQPTAAAESARDVVVPGAAVRMLRDASQSGRP